MARATGANSQLALTFESVYGTAPASGYFRMPFASTTLGLEQGLIDSELLGQGRDPLAPARDAITVDGNVVLPVDVIGIGYWLKGLLGAPTTTGTTPKTHTFNSAATSLPSLAIEKGLPDVPRYEMFTGVKVDSLAFKMERRGALQVTAALIGQGMAETTTTGAGTPTDIAVTRFGHFQGSIKRNTVSLGSIVSAEFTYANNLDRVETIRSDGKIDGVDPGVATLSGQIVARLADTTLLDQATAGTACALEFAWTIDVNTSLVITVNSAFLPRVRTPVEGPGGVQITLPFQASKPAGGGLMMTAVLKNTQAAY